MAADHQHQQQGVVIRFFNNKGYGFIKPDTSDKDLFVHQTEIQREGYRSLKEGQKVKFSVSVKNDKKVAVNVTALVECYNCGGVGHLSRDCSSVGRCYKCNKVGHIARECRRGTGRCYNCGEKGHLVKDCTDGRVDGGRVSRGKECASDGGRAVGRGNNGGAGNEYSKKR